MLKGIPSIREASISNIIIDNIVLFFDWGALEKGNYVNINKDQLNPYGIDDSQLNLVDDERYTNGQVWESRHKNWVYETGVTYNPEPFVRSDGLGCSGVYVDNTFYSVDTTGDFSHSIDHKNGRIIFDSPIDTDFTIQSDFSYKWIDFEYSDGLPWFKKIFGSLEREENSSPVESGVLYTSPENKVVLPTIGIELTNNRNFEGYQLGGGQYLRTDILFHCVAENAYVRNNLMDIVSLQNEKEFDMFNTNTIAESGSFPLVNGVPQNNSKNFPELSKSFKDKRLRVYDANLDSVYDHNSRLYIATVRMKAEVIMNSV